jgi:phage gpG-like protein
VQQLDGDDSVAAGSNAPYARIHHFGGETGRMGHRFTMVARPVLGTTPAMERRMGDFLIQSIQEAQ